MGLAQNVPIPIAHAVLRCGLDITTGRILRRAIDKRLHYYKSKNNYEFKVSQVGECLHFENETMFRRYFYDEMCTLERNE